jgi:parallel beta-helix repeat protein
MSRGSGFGRIFIRAKNFISFLFITTKTLHMYRSGSRQKTPMKNIIRCLFLIAVITTTAAAGTVYYVDATNGRDYNNGRSPSSAWQTITKVSDQYFNPGDTILFKRGQEWREVLRTRTSGTSSNPIIFSAYGSGALPVINGADLISGWSRTSGYDNVWQAAVTTEPIQVFFDGTKGVGRDRIGLVNIQYGWYWSGNVLYVYSTSDPDTAYTHPGIEAGARNSCIDIYDRSYLVFDSFHCRYNNHFSQGAIRIHLASSYIKVQNCTINYVTRGVDIGSSGSQPHYILNNTIAHCMSVGIKIGGVNCLPGNMGRIRGNDVSLTDRDGINCEANYWIIENNVVHDIAPHDQDRQGIEMYSKEGAGHGQHNIIRYNIVYNVNSNGDGGDAAGINMDHHADYNEVYYNLVYNCDGPGIYIYCSKGHDIYNNVCYGNGQGVNIWHKVEIGLSGQPGWDRVEDVRVKNNLLFSTVDGGWAIEADLMTFDNSGLDIDYNCYYRTSGDWWKWGSTRGSSLEEWRATSSQGDHDINQNPDMIDPAGRDFMLNASSPCVDAGTDVSLSRDFAGTTVPFGPGVDIGAFEYEEIFPLLVEISASPTTGWAPLTVSFQSSVSGGREPYTYSWDFGDTNSSDQADPSHIYASSGDYTAVLTVTDDDSTVGSDSVIIHVLPAVSDSTLSISRNTGQPAPGNGGTTDPAPGVYSYTTGSSVQISATEYTDYRFSEWTGDVSPQNVYDQGFQLVMDSDKTVSANFCVKCGDLNGNLAISPLDAQAAFDFYLGKIPELTRCQKENGDVNCDGTKDEPKITPSDAQWIFEAFLGRRDLPADCSGASRSDSVAVSFARRGPSQEIIRVWKDTSIKSNREILIPINIEHSVFIDSFGFDFCFDPDVLQFITAIPSEQSRGFHHLECHEFQEGILRVGGYAVEPIRFEGTDELVTLIFRINDDIKTPLMFCLKNPVDDLDDGRTVSYSIIGN